MHEQLRASNSELATDRLQGHHAGKVITRAKWLPVLRFRKKLFQLTYTFLRTGFRRNQ